MKLIVSGATGFVATEIIRQALQRQDITSLVVLSRKPIATPEVNAAKLKQVLVKDYAEYSDDVKKEFVDANACIWTVAITPAKSKAYNADDLRRICYTSTVEGINAMYNAPAAKPFRFLYTSGHGIERNLAKPPMLLGPYLMLRAETESKVLEFGQQHAGDVEVSIARPGLVTSNVNILRSVWGAVLKVAPLATSITLENLAAAMLEQAVKGFEKETLTNDDLVRIGRNVLESEVQK